MVHVGIDSIRNVSLMRVKTLDPDSGAGRARAATSRAVP